MAKQSFRCSLVAGSSEITALSVPYAACSYANITAVNNVLNTNRWEMIYSATATLDASLKITGEHANPVPEGEERQYYSGRIRQPQGFRRTWRLTSQPIYYAATAYPDWDVDDIEYFMRYLASAPHLWANIITPRMTSSDYIPVIVRDWSITDNDETATKRLSLTLVHAFPDL